MAASLAVVLAATTFFGGPVGASPSATLVFSVDGGTTWSANINAAPGQTVLARQYYDNDTNGTMSGVSVTTTIPGGFTLVAGSTKVCLNPGTTDPNHPTTELACNTDAGQGGPINEAAVWSGSNLAISPTAGLLTQSTSATSGVMQVGEPRYLNLEQCVYYSAAVNDALTYVVSTTPSSVAGIFGAPSGTSNVAAAPPSCLAGSTAGGYPLQASNSGVENVPLLGHRYFNLNQCNYFSGADSLTYFINTTSNPGYGAGTATSNSTPSAPSCGAGIGGYVEQPVNSGIANVDLLGATTLNLEDCEYSGSAHDALTYAVPVTANTPFGASAGASGGNVATQTCKPGAGGYLASAGNSGVANLSLVDTTRGQGFVQFSMVAPSPATTTRYTEPGQLNGAGTGNPAALGTITVDASVGTPLLSLWVGGGLTGLAAAGGAVLFARRRGTPKPRSVRRHAAFA